MLADAPIPERILALIAASTLFVVMFEIGLGVVISEFRWVLRRRALVGKALCAVLVAVPIIAMTVVRALDLPREAGVGIVLMAISPGAPVALRRSLEAGGHRAFASALQMLVAMLAVAWMPLSVAAIDQVYGLKATIDPTLLAKQVFVAQFLPLGLGMAVRGLAPRVAEAMSAKLGGISRVLLIALLVLVLVDVWKTVVDAGPRIVLAIVAVTMLALATGHALGGPAPTTRSAVAITSALRNPGLALLVATANAAPAGVVATVFAYLVVAGFAVLGYVAWRRRAGADPRASGR